MGIDINDVKIVIKACFQYLMKTCYQWGKDHPFVTIVLLFFYLLYIFSPYLFSLLFYTFPLVICFAILLGGPRFSLEKHQKNTKKDEGNTSNYHKNRRPQLQSQMSRRTVGRLFTNNPTQNKLEDLYHRRKTQKNLTSLTPNRSDTDSLSEEDEAHDQHKNKLVVEWTEDDQRNLMELGSSEIERNKRLESLIAKRRARKMLSMQPRRHNNSNNNNCCTYEQDGTVDDYVVGPVLISRRLGVDDGDHHQPGSAPSILLPNRNPFDLPYDPHEEKPVLTGGSFGEEFFPGDEHVKDRPLDDLKDDSNTHFGILTKPRMVGDNRPGLTRFRRESDAEEKLKELSEQLSKEGFEQGTNNHEVLSEGVQPPPQLQGDNNHGGPTTTSGQLDDENQSFENPFAVHGETVGSSSHYFIRLPKSNQESTNHTDDEMTTSKDSTQVNLIKDDDTQPTQQDHVELSDHKGHVDKDDDEEQSSSSSSTNEVISVDADKNEAFRSSVKKVLTCLAFPRNTGVLIKEHTNSLPNEFRDVLASETSPTNALLTKMQERSYYTRPHHTSNFSIASDMQVEVSEPGSPPRSPSTVTAISNAEPNSPTYPESYDGDVDKDANSGDDDELWGASPHPTKLGEFGHSFKLHKGLIKDTTNKDNNVTNNSESDQGIEGVIPSFSPRSILPNDNKNKIAIDDDVRSVDGDIVHPRLSTSSSSEGLTQQMQCKAEHLAEYLASLPPTPSECGSNMLEEGEPSHVNDEINPIFEEDENKDLLEGSQGSSEGSVVTINQIEAPKEITSSSSNEFSASELKKELDDRVISVIEQNEDQLRKIENNSESIATNENPSAISSPKKKLDDPATSAIEQNEDQSRKIESISQDNSETIATNENLSPKKEPNYQVTSAIEHNEDQSRKIEDNSETITTNKNPGAISSPKKEFDDRTTSAIEQNEDRSRKIEGNGETIAQYENPGTISSPKKEFDDRATSTIEQNEYHLRKIEGDSEIISTYENPGTISSPKKELDDRVASTAEQTEDQSRKVEDNSETIATYENPGTISSPKEELDDRATYAIEKNEDQLRKIESNSETISTYENPGTICSPKKELDDGDTFTIEQNKDELSKIEGNSDTIATYENPVTIYSPKKELDNRATTEIEQTEDQSRKIEGNNETIATTYENPSTISSPKKKLDDQATSAIEQNKDQSKKIEANDETIATNETHGIISSPKKETSTSLSTTREGDIIDQSKIEGDLKIKPQNQAQNEVKTVTFSEHIYCEETPSKENVEDEANHGVNHPNEKEEDPNEREDNKIKVDNMDELETIEHTNVTQPSLLQVVNPRNLLR